MTAVATGTIVDGRYRILGRVGSGGMADVWLAEDAMLGRKVALKVLYQRFAEDSEFVERFRREASSAAALQHPNVVGVFDRGEWDGHSYIAMEYLEGRSLKQVIVEQGPLAPARAIDLALQILKAARCGHRRGIVHRDLKPHNVIVDDEGRAKVTDFGIARAGASDMTQTGSIMGTAQYLSPEQAQGHAVSPASDLYAVGIVLYEMLTGRVPFDGETAVAIALKQITEPPLPPSVLQPSIPPALEAVVMRALEKDPIRRYGSADEFIVALERVRAGAGRRLGEPTSAWSAARNGELVAAPALDQGVWRGPPPPGGEQAEPPRRRRWPWVLAVLLALAGAASAAALLHPWDRAPARVAVPDVVGRAYADAKTALSVAGFQVRRASAYDRAPRGQVYATDPGARTLLPKGSPVTVRVSKGPAPVVVPNVVGVSQSSAENQLSERGLFPVSRDQASSAVPVGDVVRTDPTAGTRLAPGSRVTLWISTGAPRVSVPGVVGKSLSDARAALAAVGLSSSVSQRQTSAAPSGTVVAQGIAAGTSVIEGSTVPLVVAAAPPPPPPAPSPPPATLAIPDVTGRSEQTARRALESRGFTVARQVQDVTDPGQDGRVLSQDPGGGTQASRGSTVTLVVGRLQPTTSPSPPGPGATTSPTPSPAPSPAAPGGTSTASP